MGRQQAFFYSVPHTLIHKQVDLRATARTIEFFHRRQAHCRPSASVWRSSSWNGSGSYAQLPPAIYRVDADRFHRWTASIGPPTEGGDSNSRQPPTPEQGFRACLGVLRLFRDIEQSRRGRVRPRCRDRRAELQSIASLLVNYNAARHSTEPTAIVDYAFAWCGRQGRRLFLFARGRKWCD
ncbi:Mu transposase domain-containing protein [Mesorhizobium opportunistum]|uniref:Mu transposase domain-containing protein n=1 Tax=Mesorhizobium opportunistum TaxID=593909 RepID=UPI003DA12D8E